MTVAFQDLAEVFDPDLYLPIRGKTYRVPAPDAARGLRLMALFRLGVAAQVSIETGLQAQLAPEDLAKLQLDGDDETRYLKDCLGSAFEEMQADEVAWEYVQHAANTAFMRWTVGPDAAALFWAQAAPEWVGAGKAGALGRLRTETRAGTAVESTSPASASATGTTNRARSTTPGRKAKRKG